MVMAGYPNSLPDNIEEIINNICDLVEEEEETALTEELKQFLTWVKKGLLPQKKLSSK